MFQPKGTRRSVLAAMIAIGSLMPARETRAEPTAEEAKPAVWLIGRTLSLAAVYYYGNGPSEQEKKWFVEAQNWAQKLGIQVKDFPPGPTGPGEGLIELLKYFNEGGDGARIGSTIRSKYGAYHATLYDIAVRLLLMMRIYRVVDPAESEKFARGIQLSATSTGLPQSLWTPPVSAVMKRASSDEVGNAVLKAEDDVFGYLIEVARGQKP
jgi:hypothetical protein